MGKYSDFVVGRRRSLDNDSATIPSILRVPSNKSFAGSVTSEHTFKKRVISAFKRSSSRKQKSPPTTSSSVSLGGQTPVGMPRSGTFASTVDRVEEQKDLGEEEPTPVSTPRSETFAATVDRLKRLREAGESREPSASTSVVDGTRQEDPTLDVREPTPVQRFEGLTKRMADIEKRADDEKESMLKLVKKLGEIQKIAESVDDTPVTKKDNVQPSQTRVSVSAQGPKPQPPTSAAAAVARDQTSVASKGSSEATRRMKTTAAQPKAGTAVVTGEPAANNEDPSIKDTLSDGQEQNTKAKPGKLAMVRSESTKREEVATAEEQQPSLSNIEERLERLAELGKGCNSLDETATYSEYYSDQRDYGSLRSDESELFSQESSILSGTVTSLPVVPTKKSAHTATQQRVEEDAHIPTPELEVVLRGIVVVKKLKLHLSIGEDGDSQSVICPETIEELVDVDCDDMSVTANESMTEDDITYHTYDDDYDEVSDYSLLIRPSSPEPSYLCCGPVS